MTYIPKDGTQVRKVFMPICNDNHWYACIVDLDKQKTFILDSMSGEEVDLERREIVIDVVRFLIG